METGGNRYYYHFDALGSVRNLTDSTGATSASYEYNVYGQFNLTGNSHGNPYAFTGRQWDEESVLYYYRARYFAPVIGRFLQTDPLYNVNKPNLYVYVTNNPLNALDPYGLAPFVNDSSKYIVVSGNPGPDQGSGDQIQFKVPPGGMVDAYHPFDTGKGIVYDVDFVDFNGNGIAEYSGMSGIYPFGEKLPGGDSGWQFTVMDNPFKNDGTDDWRPFIAYPSGWVKPKPCSEDQ